MPQSHARSCCRKPDRKELFREDAGLDWYEDALLTISRHYFDSFAVPQSHSWYKALLVSQAVFGVDEGAVISARWLAVIQAMRCTRKSVFGFNSPACKGCAAILTEHERRLMKALGAIRRGQNGIAQTELMMLCEGYDTVSVMDAFGHLAEVLPNRDVKLPASFSDARI